MMPSNKLILASQSRGRKQLLEAAGFSFEVKKLDVVESFPDDLPADKVAEYLAMGKNAAHRRKFPHATIISADTVVTLDEKIFGKPGNSEEAEEMLHFISGKVHNVTTGVCISNPSKHKSFSNTTRVKVKLLTHKEIHHYVEVFSPFDKAGAYGIQEWFGLIAVEWIMGSYYNVVGLPIHKIHKMLVDYFGITPTK